MNNYVFGKTLENIRNRVDIRLISRNNVAQNVAAKPNYDCCTIFDENLIAVHVKKTKLYVNKPVYLGMSILDRSKSLMYDFHYNYINTKYGDKAKLLFTDTDSLAYEIKTKDFYKDIYPDIEKRFDTSDYPTNHPSGIKTGLNSKVLGMFKDKAGRKEQHRKMNVIRSHCHEIYTEEFNKIALSSDDVKRVIMADGIQTLAYEHTNLKNCN